MEWFLGVAILLMFLEVVLPGGIAFAFGISTFILVLLNYFDLQLSWVDTFLIWALISISWLLLVAVFSRFVLKSHVETKDLYDHSDWLDPVEVVEDINEGNHPGRIFYKGSTWNAITKSGSIKKGSFVKIIQKENLTFIVRPIEKDL